MTTARHWAIDRLRRARATEDKRDQLARLHPPIAEPVEPDQLEEPDEASIPDERLALIFTCCHPALGVEAQVALTLRLVAGPDRLGDRAGVL